MKLLTTFTLIAMSVVVKGNLWAAAVQPVILSIGAVLAAIDLDVLDVQRLPFINKQDKNEEKEVKEAKEPTEARPQ